jgi:hypothetical protein
MTHICATCREPMRFRRWRNEIGSPIIAVECGCGGTIGFSCNRWDALLQYVVYRKGLLPCQEWCIWL